jgi:glyoxylase-like metal-dependent hydrolase (beta-lactamase superfamily II)
MSTIDKYPQADVRISKYTMNADTSGLTAPESLKAAKVPPMVPDPKVDVQQVADGVWFLGGQTHNSVLVAFADHTVLIEVPQNEVRTMAVISAARDVVPNKPLMQVVVTHHHFDHSGGIRAAVSEGLTLVAHESNKAFFADLILRHHSIYKDALSQNPKRLDIQTVGDHSTMKDAKQTLELYNIAVPGHVQSLLIAYLPKDRIIVQGDLFSPTFASEPFLGDFLRFMEEHKLKVDKHVPIHGPVMTDAEFRKAVANMAIGAGVPKGLS